MKRIYISMVDVNCNGELIIRYYDKRLAIFSWDMYVFRMSDVLFSDNLFRVSDCILKEFYNYLRILDFRISDRQTKMLIRFLLDKLYPFCPTHIYIDEFIDNRVDI